MSSKTFSATNSAQTEENLKSFIHGTERYFQTVTATPAAVSTPYVMEKDDRVVYDFSAVIGVSGQQRGCVYYSAPREMVRELVGHLGETMMNDEIFADYVGEIANTISGNAREQLGPGFMISVPVVFTTGADGGGVRFPQDIATIVIPLEWKNYRSSLILALKETDPSESAPRADLSKLDDDTP